MTFSEMWEANAVPAPPRPNWVKCLFAFYGIAILMGILASVLFIPFVILTSSAAKAVPEVWGAIDGDISSFDGATASRPVILTDKDGNEFAKFASESRIPLTYDQLGTNIQNALVATEDASFWKHKGVDDRGVMRAIARRILLKSGEGASTITMQLVKNLQEVVALHDGDEEGFERAKENTMSRKIQEVKKAIEYESKHTKQEIMTTYLNTVYFGNSLYGLGAAAQGYYSKNAKDLTVPEAALIAGIVQSPSAYNPVKNPEKAKTRRDMVLDRMEASGYITEAENKEYKKENINLKPNPKPVGSMGCANSKYPYYCSLVKEELLNSSTLGKEEKTRNAKFSAGGFTVQTALDPKVYDGVNGAAQDFKSKPYQTGIAAVQPNTGLIEGIGQSTTFDETQVVYASSKLQTGSTFKPITIAAAIENGIDPDQSFNVTDGYYSSVFQNPPGGYGNSVYTAGYMSLRQAVKTSNNVYFVKLLEQVGVIPTAKMAQTLGLKDTPNNLTGVEGGLTLGSYEGSPIQLASVYATFAAGGVYCDPHTITSVGDKKVSNTCRRAITGRTAATINDLLSEPLKPGGTADNVRLNADARAKSGSTDEYAVLWLSAYTPKGVVTGWVADPAGPSANPVRNVNVYGDYQAVGHGGDTAGLIVGRAFNQAGIGSDKWPTADTSGDIIHYDNSAPEVKGMDPESAISALLNSGRTSVTVSNSAGAKSIVVGFDESTNVLTVSGRPDLNGYKFYTDEKNGKTKKVKIGND